MDVYKGKEMNGAPQSANYFTSFKMGKSGADQIGDADLQLPKRPDGTLVLKTKAAVIPGVQAWVELDGKRVADWDVGTSEVRVTISAGNHRVAVYSIFRKVRRTIFEEQIEVAPDTTLPVDVES